MAKPTARRAWSDASRFDRAEDSLDEMVPQRCCWPNCRDYPFIDLPLCKMHALMAGQYMRDAMRQAMEKYEPQPVPKPQPFVYYLMIGPSTVKIGTTTGLPQRLNALRTEAQYVVAIELGGRELEQQRHKEFADERLGRREDFRLSDRLKNHIEALQPDRDELVAYALSYPKVTA